MNPKIEIHIITTPDNHYIFIIECKTVTNKKVSIQSTQQYKTQEEAKKDALESLSEFTTEVKLQGSISFNYH